MLGRITRNEAEEVFKRWQSDGKIKLSKLNDTEKLHRERLVMVEAETLKELENRELSRKNYYQFDLLFSLKLYEYLSVQNGVGEREASDDDFWRFVSMKLIPDVIERRWEGLKATRFYQESRRIWLKALWWYIHLSWQGSISSTYDILKDNTTDTIVQLVERPGSGGYRISLTRNLMRYYGTLAEQQPKKHSTEIFRKIMRLNTARTKVVEPALVDGGEQEYVKELFEYFDAKDRAI
ncbi:hypothetical protein [Edaphobacillus lindanitolerans]|uniref:Uncharacterized protein n=1 Tax=Edaphobacillus lindanitolerans TaxID=550447 RepID=A0A1U7PRN3_9BACI|nr:hypothetical protein [Edaphobacillus lindanitolerans]SIT87333.1 hypothetical protein SAMN05428946_2069 [Edaphobacillus lindanitolerans]